MTRLRYLPNVTTLAVDVDKCVGCGMCATVCPHGVFAVEDGKARIRILNRDACMECGACAGNCPVDAVSVEAGVGCASGVIRSALRGQDTPCCGSDSCCGK
jgi:ferredoxin